ncbi:uncharacterized protein [Rutidosis leptorrhynchoides]|uniref:uncharacterized protein n=1 Tax=Rutidosis leptorrhynchoides TaxID=125765 RepID=UPI003A99B993
MVVLWNLSIQKSIGIAIRNHLYLDDGLTVVGFRVCSNTIDPKLVKITTRVDKTSGNDTFTWEVEVYTVSSGVWRSIPIDFPRKSTFFTWGQTFVDGVIYWHAFDNNEMDDGSCNMIISFDLTSKEFEEVLLQDCLVRFNGNLCSSKLKESLVVVKSYYEADKPVCDVWILRDGVPKSFAKLFNIVAPNGSVYSDIHAFRKNGGVIMKIDYIESTSTTLQVWFEAKVTIRSKMSLIREIKNKLTPAQTKIFRGTCFGHWLDINCDDNDPGYIHCILMNQIDRPKNFSINEREICEEPEELWF